MPGCAPALQFRRRFAGVDQETDMQLRIASNASRFKTRNLFVLKDMCFNVPLDGADFSVFFQLALVTTDSGVLEHNCC